MRLPVNDPFYKTRSSTRERAAIFKVGDCCRIGIGFAAHFRQTYKETPAVDLVFVRLL
jgi:hypothetical protein